MFNGRQDIIGDLYRLRQQYLSGENERLDELEMLAAAAVSHGMSYAIVAKASGVPRGRVDAMLDRSPVAIRRQMSAYRREPTGIVIRTDR